MRRIFLIWCLGASLGFAENRDPSAQRAEFLRQEIARHDELYFRQAAPEISDTAYDELKAELDEISSAGSTSAQRDLDRARASFGDDRVQGFAKRRHGVPMQSLSKVYSKEALLGFLDRCSRLTGPVVFVAEPKFDGLAVSATYENGRLIRVVTRGDGLEGDDVTTNAVRFANIPQTLVGEQHGDFPHRIELRGEVFMQWKEFRRLQDESDDAERPVFQSPRNLAAGTLKSIEGKEHEMRRLSVVFYGVGDCEPASAAPDSEVALLAQLHRWGLPTVESPQISKSLRRFGLRSCD